LPNDNGTPAASAHLDRRARRREDARVLTVRTGQPIPVHVSTPARMLAGRRVKAARLLAGGMSIRDVARAEAGGSGSD